MIFLSKRHQKLDRHFTINDKIQAEQCVQANRGYSVRLTWTLSDIMKAKKILSGLGIFGSIAVISCFLTWLNPSTRGDVSWMLYYLRGETGHVEMFFDDGSRERWYYEDGKREGIWKRWDSTGELVNECEYRDDKPWDGLCRIFDQKEFYAEYREGSPWNGALWWMQDDKEGGCFIDGKEVSLQEYRDHFDLGEAGTVAGIDLWSTTETKNTENDPESEL